MSLSREEVLELANVLNARAGLGRSERPKLRLVVPPTSKLLDPIFREAHIKRAIFLRDRYRLQWMVDQATFNVASLSCLEDCDLIRLLADMERARECMADGISFEDAGLIQSIDAPSHLIPSRSGERQAEIAEMAINRLPSPIDDERQESPF